MLLTIWQPIDELLAASWSKLASFLSNSPTDGQEALEKIELRVPDLVLTDLQMPELNGLQLVEAIRDRFPQVPAVLMTAKGSEDIAVEALDRGAASYVPKRHLSDNLLETVWRVLAAARKTESHRQIMNRMTEMTWVLENDLSLLSDVVAHIGQLLRERDILTENETIRVTTGIDEALLNAYYHGNLEIDSRIKNEDPAQYEQLANERRVQPPFHDRRIRLTAKLARDSSTFVVGDDGSGFDSDSLSTASTSDFLERRSGRGLILMRSFMDDVSFNRAGNEVTLVKRSQQANARKVETLEETGSTVFQIEE